MPRVSIDGNCFDENYTFANVRQQRQSSAHFMSGERVNEYRDEAKSLKRFSRILFDHAKSSRNLQAPIISVLLMLMSSTLGSLIAPPYLHAIR